MRKLFDLRYSILMAALAAVYCQISALSNSGKNLILEMEEVGCGNKPIFDCACLDQKVTHAWFSVAPKDCDNMQVAFKTAPNGEAFGVRLVGSSGSHLCDTVALNVITNTRFLYIPTGDAEIVFNFHISRITARLEGSAIILPPGKQAPPVVFVKSKYESIPGMSRPDCFSYTDLNNKGVLDILEGNLLVAEKDFKEANQRNPSYGPAVHNLKLVELLRMAR